MISAFDAIGLTAMFVICASLLLWIIIGAKGWWWLKLPVIALTLYFGVAVWYSVDSYLGWPSKHDPPRLFQVNWVIVDEPAKGTSDPGAIYVLLTKLDHPDDKKQAESSWSKYLSILGYVGSKDSPRLYQVPYSRPLHEKMAKVQGMLMKGKFVMGEFTKGKGMGQPGNGDGEGDGKGNGKGEGEDGKKGKGKGYRGDNWGMGDWHFYQLPPPKHIPKIDGGG